MSLALSPASHSPPFGPHSINLLLRFSSLLVRVTSHIALSSAHPIPIPRSRRASHDM